MLSAPGLGWVSVQAGGRCLLHPPGGLGSRDKRQEVIPCSAGLVLVQTGAGYFLQHAVACSFDVLLTWSPLPHMQARCDTSLSAPGQHLAICTTIATQRACLRTAACA